MADTSALTNVAFDSSNLFTTLLDAQASPHVYDDCDFGIVVMNLDGTVRAYNRYEAQAAGLHRESVIGSDFFTAVAPCTNNEMVAGRFDAANELDATIDYVFAFKMKMTPVKLRLLKSSAKSTQILVVKR